MRIKKLELAGFKSFKDRTVIHYDAGITGIVGPNGCGKSNIVDALVWVMGEMSAKHLRGSSMEDVIFAGADGYAPVGLAEVSLTLENDGGPFPVKYMNHSEVMVTRRLHRSGESEYLINKESARLKDIQEIFMDTGAGSKGFSIIEQGAIGRIVTSKPEERRTLIEEAAGITKFKARKRESQRRLKTTEANLVRLKDIITELKRQLDSLQRQAQRAERYRKLKTQIEDLELWLISVEYKELLETSKQAETVITHSEEREAVLKSELSQVEATLQELRTALSEKENEITGQQQANKQMNETVREKEKQIQELHFEIEQARRSEEMTGSLAEESLGRKQLLEKDVAALKTRLQELEASATSAKEAFEGKKTHFDDQSQSIQRWEEELTVSRRELLTVMQAESTLDSRLLGLRESLEEIQQKNEELQQQKEEMLDQQKSIQSHHRKVSSAYDKERQLQLEVVNDIDTLEANKKHVEEDLMTRRQEMEQYKDRLNEVSSRLYGLEDLQNNFEGFQEGVKSVMQWQKESDQKEPSYAPVAEVIEVPSQYEVALEAALGPRMQIVLSENNEQALKAVDYLKENKTGRSSFFSSEGLQVVPTADLEPLRAESRVKALLKDVVKMDDKHQELVSRVVDRVAIVESLMDGIDLQGSHPTWTFVTQEGDMVSPDGLITGGSAEDVTSGVLKRQREIKELKTQKEEWGSKVSLAEITLKKVESTAKQMEEDLQKARSDKMEKEIAVASLLKDLDQAEAELKSAEAAMGRHQQECDTLSQKLQSRQDEMSSDESRLVDLRERKVELETKSEELEKNLSESKAGIQALQEETTQLQIENAKKQQELEGVKREHEMLSESLKEINERLGRMTEETQKNSAFVSENALLLEENKIELDVLIRRQEEGEELASKMKNDYEVTQGELQNLQDSVSDQMTENSEIQSRLSQSRLEFEQSKMKMDHLTEQILEKYQKDLSQIYSSHLDHEGSQKEAEAELKDLKGKLGRIGEVNLSAIDEYDEIAERYAFLSQQFEDLIQAKDQLRKVIDRINRICSRRFKETFEAVNERFKKVFPVLFGGGEAHLILIEDPEKEEMGIDIISRPPGKKMQSVSLMSGGEKALTAVSLIFSIFLVKPSPYCLLDEVDAPLDDANVMRFNELVKEMAKRSQIIVVTHNKYTMEVAEKLYGVTMEEKGVSKMVSVDLG